jgi:hypothetical protein
VATFKTEPDHDGAWLVAGECGQGDGYVEVHDGKGGVAQACPDPMEIPGLAVALYEASNLVPPVMLGRPDLRALGGEVGVISFRGLRLYRAATGGVSFAIGGNVETLTDAMARQAAAVAVALADSPEPDPDGVAVLSAVIRDADERECDADDLARIILSAGYRREAGRD